MSTRTTPTPSRELTLGSLLTRDGVISHAQLGDALAEHDRSGRRLGDILVERGQATTAELARALAEQYGLEYHDVLTIEVEPAALRLLPEERVRTYQALPLRSIGRDSVLVAVGDPTDILALDGVKLALGVRLTFCLVDPRDLPLAIDRAYERATALAVAEEFESQDLTAAVAEVELGAESGDAPLVGLLNQVLSQAIRARASDVHFDPEPDALAVRVRVDGVTRDLLTVPRALQIPLTTRLKVMAGLDIAERRQPQDGRTTVRLAGEPYDLRFAILPSSNGEKVALRILRRPTASMPLTRLGMTRDAYEAVLAAVEQPFGGIVTCGPSGAGKTTTLYALLERLNTPERVLLTVEDPIEYELEGVTQIQVRPKTGLTFARVLRTMLRADPDVLLVGEMRDAETAEIAVQAAMTGHLVLTSVHARNAAGALARLEELGVEPFMLANVLNCIVSQRLVRRLCESCRVPIEPNDRERELLSVHNGAALTIYQHGACPRCGGSGYHDRTGVFEVLPMTREIRRLIGRPAEEVEEAARELGIPSLREQACKLVLAGVTSLEEVRRVVGQPV